jgi:hypothetical protein
MVLSWNHFMECLQQAPWLDFQGGTALSQFLEPTRRETEFLPFHAARRTEIKSVHMTAG